MVEKCLPSKFVSRDNVKETNQRISNFKATVNSSSVNKKVVISSNFSASKTVRLDAKK